MNFKRMKREMLGIKLISSNNQPNCGRGKTLKQIYFLHNMFNTNTHTHTYRDGGGGRAIIAAGLSNEI